MSKSSIFHFDTLETVDLGRRDVILPMIKLFVTKNKQYETMVNFNFAQARKRHVENYYIISTVCSRNFSSQFITHSFLGRGEIVSTASQSPKGIPPKYIVEVDDCLPECCMLPVFSRQHFKWLKFRCSIRCLVEHKYLEWFILFTVMFSSFVLVRTKNESYLICISCLERRTCLWEWPQKN